MVFAGKQLVPTFASHVTDHFSLVDLSLFPLSTFHSLYIYIYIYLTTSLLHMQNHWSFTIQKVKFKFNFSDPNFQTLASLVFDTLISGEMDKEGFGLEITELRLGLPGGESICVGDKNEKKRVFWEIEGEEDENSSSGDRKMQTKNQVVGWPPVCSYRKKNSMNETTKMYVKVSMDGAPFLRKIDLGMHKGYSELASSLEKFFGCYGIGEALKDADNSEHVPIYEDKDGDWMLVGDVPWEMFIESCKRLRIMKRSDAKGFDLQPKGSLKGFIEGVRK